jgi:hypothetical protein
VLDLQDVVRRLLDCMRDGVAVRRTEQECPQYQHVERAGQDVAAGIGVFTSRHALEHTPEEFLVEACLE